MSEAPTLYAWAGGRAPIEAMIGSFYDRVERDDLLSPFFPGGVSAEHRARVTTWWCEVFGPCAPLGLGSRPALPAVSPRPAQPLPGKFRSTCECGAAACGHLLVTTLDLVKKCRPSGPYA
jgi:hypothetical protein